MTFHSFDFVLFFLVVLATYHLLSRVVLQNIFLLGASYFFYGYIHSWFLILIIVSTLVDYSSALGMQRFPVHKKLFLLFSVCVNLGILFVFKYFNFFIENIQMAASSLGFSLQTNMLSAILPVGISFYTFQTLSYSIDVYRGIITPRKNLLSLAVYVAFFPQLVAGPIERATHLLPQIEKRRNITGTMTIDGMSLLAWGFFKKLVIADNLAIIVEKIFLLEQASFPIIWVGTLAFAFQIYADFSGYVDIARGSAKLLGFTLLHNFRNPYLSNSPKDFWQRWHISLSEWIRDYLYIPLGGSRKGVIRNCINVLLVFFLVGLWHGASWNFVVWGLYWGILLLIHRWWTTCAVPWKESFLYQPLCVLSTFSLTVIGWLLFRETDMHYLLQHFLQLPTAASARNWYVASNILAIVLYIASPVIVHMLYSEYLQSLLHRRVALCMQWVGIAISIVCIIYFHSISSVDFIYFQY